MTPPTSPDDSLRKLGELLRDAFGWDGDVTVSPGPRGAVGRVWLVQAGGSRYALKENFFDPPDEALVEAEVMFLRAAAAATVQAPAIHADRTGRHLLAGPDGTWLRLYDWVDVGPLDLTAPATPAAVGELLARLHRCAPAASGEPGGGAPLRWYDHPPDIAEFATVGAAAAPWADRLEASLAMLPHLRTIATPVDPARLLLCHRDLHPGNVVGDATGAPVVLDWDNLGPADPSRELAQALVDWWCDGEVDAGAMRAMYDAYVRSGGPGRVRQQSDFSMLVSVRLNFLLVQLKAFLDEQVEAEHRVWAEQEIDESLRIMPTPAQLSEVLDLTRAGDR